jgi:hypothetical protein
MQTRRRAALAAAGAAAVLALVAVPTAAWADPPAALPENADAADLAVAPAMDYDTDGCYPTPAVGPDGTAAEGLNNSGALNGNCHDVSDLDNTNAYVRTVCSNGWCAHLYGYYFEKDQVVAGADAFGHRNDLEHVIVWTQDGDAHPKFVSASAHGNYDTRSADGLQFEGDHAKIVYHKDGASTHSMRFAKTDGGDEPPENDYHVWQYPDLLSWDLLSDPVRSTLQNHDYGSATLDLKDGRIADVLNGAKPDGIPFQA